MESACSRSALNVLLMVSCAGRPPDEEVVSCSHYDDVQLPLWEKLAEERLRMNQAKRKFSSEKYRLSAAVAVY